VLRRLWAQGVSASRVAGVLEGCSRNSVMGKVARRKLRALPCCQHHARRAYSSPAVVQIPVRFRAFGADALTTVHELAEAASGWGLRIEARAR
jgi:hypothetical protein